MLINQYNVLQHKGRTEHDRAFETGGTRPIYEVG